MQILGLEELVFGVDEVASAAKFLVDYGLAAVDVSAAGGRFEAADGSAIVVRLSSDPALPEGLGKSPAIRETVYAVADAATLDQIEAEISKDRVVTRGADGSVALRDDFGFALRFQISRRRPVKPAPLEPQLNVPGVLPGMEAKPVTLSHVVYFVPDSARAEAFYRDRLGFVTTDTFENVGPFMRAPAQTDHHAIFFIQTPPFMQGVEHFTFHMRSAGEVLLAGQAFVQKGYKSFWGPGRHIFGSNWFWYFNSPLGCNIEYDAEMDQHDETWTGRTLPMTPETAQIFLFAGAEKWIPGPGKKPPGA